MSARVPPNNAMKPTPRGEGILTPRGAAYRERWADEIKYAKTSNQVGVDHAPPPAPE